MDEKALERGIEIRNLRQEINQRIKNLLSDKPTPDDLQIRIRNRGDWGDWVSIPADIIPFIYKSIVMELNRQLVNLNEELRLL